MFHRFIQYLLKNQVLFALFIIAFGWFIVQIREIIVSIFLAYIIMSALLPIVNFLKKKRFPKVFAVLIPYLSIFIAIFLLILPLVPFGISQIYSLITSFPEFINSSAGTFGLKIDPKQFEGYLSSEINNLGKSAVDVTTKVFGGLFSIITIFVVSLYFLLYEDSFKKFLAETFHNGSKEKVLTTLDTINYKLGAWFRGQVLLCFFIGLFSWVGLTVLNLPYALPLALLAGLLEIIPTIGPILSSIPAIIIALTISPTMALAVIVFYILIQAIENQFLVPKVMEKAVGLNPVIIILSIMIGTKLMGVAGALLAIPFLSFIFVVFQSFDSKK